MSSDSAKYNIICLSNQLWDFPNWTNKRHVMMRLAQQGHNVLFVDPPINAGRVLLTQIKRNNWDVPRLATQYKKDQQANAHIFTPINLIPVSQATSKIHATRINQLANRHFDPKLKTLLWVYHVQIPQLEYYLKNLKHDFLIYDCVDNYSGFPSSKNPLKAAVSSEKVDCQEKYLATRADLVFATAPGLVEKMQKYNKNVFFTPNVGDYEKFKNNRQLKDQIPQDLKDIKRPRIGFTGSLDDYKFDYDLVRKIAKDHPNYQFVLIGPQALKDREASDTIAKLENLPNVHALGSRPFTSIEYYFAGFDAFMIPYVLNDYTVGGCFPIKFHDALAAGLPTIVTNMPAYLPFADVAYISKNYEEFSQNIKNALERDTPERIKARQLVAKDNSWEGKIQKLLSLINQHIAV
jgi:glycosyltransferase involved in cell wall biosynthesis